MIIQIHDRLTIRELSGQFNRHFPFLRLDFFHPDKNGDIRPALRIDEKSILHVSREPFEISIDANDKVEKIERIFREAFGVQVQVFRRSGNIWILTTSTDHLTIGEQNALAKEMAIAAPPPVAEDIHEQE
jgi:hypothetical protein